MANEYRLRCVNPPSENKSLAYFRGGIQRSGDYCSILRANTYSAGEAIVGVNWLNRVTSRKWEVEPVD